MNYWEVMETVKEDVFLEEIIHWECAIEGQDLVTDSSRGSSSALYSLQPLSCLKSHVSHLTSGTK